MSTPYTKRRRRKRPRKRREPAKTERNALIVNAIHEGARYEDMAAAHGVSPERIRQIYERAVVRRETPEPAKKKYRGIARRLHGSHRSGWDVAGSGALGPDVWGKIKRLQKRARIAPGDLPRLVDEGKAAGKSFRVIGDELGYSKARVYQVHKEKRLEDLISEALKKNTQEHNTEKA